VKNSAGSSSEKKNIEVKSISSIGIVPTIFTPNYDGENDFFSFEMKNIASIEVTIVDMKGIAIYSSTNLEGKWDGKMKDGADAIEGEYVYIIHATGTDSVPHTKKGTVTLRRSSQQ
jgi:gliding motility-associated-like protein